MLCPPLKVTATKRLWSMRESWLLRTYFQIRVRVDDVWRVMVQLFGKQGARGTMAIKLEVEPSFFSDRILVLGF